MADPAPPEPAPPDRDQLAADFARLTEGEGPPDPSEAVPLVRAFARGARQAGLRAATGGRWLLDTTLTTAEHLPVRSLEDLQRHHRGLTGPMLADALVRNASRSSAAVGAAAGGLVTAQELVPPSWWTIPFSVAAETALVVAIEMKLVGELHEAYHRPIPGTSVERGMAIAAAWSSSRGVRPTDLLLSRGAVDLVGRQARTSLSNQLRKRLARRTSRSLGTVIPLMIGAGVAAELNRRATRTLGESVQRDLSGITRT